MTILAIPFLDLTLVAHSSGGVILRGATGYIGGTFVDASIVGAFSTAGAALQSMGTSAVALASNPYVIGGVVIAAVAVGTYCYFNGIPAPVAETILHAGLGAQTDKGLMISAPKLATALVLLGAAGYVVFRFYQNFRELWADTDVGSTWNEASEKSARDITVRSFGADVWATMGKAAWATKDDVAQALAVVAQEAVDRVSRAAEAISTGAAAAYDVATIHTAKATNSGSAKLQRWGRKIRSVWVSAVERFGTR
jgi:hypothetical protein